MSLKLVSHRGNTSGQDVEFENTPEYLLRALELGYDIELDVWMRGDHIYLGHDQPERVSHTHALWRAPKDRMWVHAKDLASLETFRVWRYNVFWNDKDAYALTSYGNVWANYDQAGDENTVHMLRKGEATPIGCLGVCTDWPEDYR